MSERFDRELQDLLQRETRVDRTDLDHLTAIASQFSRGSRSKLRDPVARIAGGIALAVVASALALSSWLAWPAPRAGIVPGASPSVAPSPSPRAPEPSPQAVATTGLPELDSTLSGTLWAFPHAEGWVAGDLAGRQIRTEVPYRAMVASAWGRLLAWKRDADGSKVFYVVEASSGRATEVYRVNDEYLGFSATLDQSGETLYYHASNPGNGDGGVRRVDLATRTETSLVSGDPSEKQKNRLLLIWSPTGRTLVSTLCDAEECAADVVDVLSGKAQRIPGPFNARAATDRYLLGRVPSADGADPWSIYDLDKGAARVIAARWIAQVGQGVVAESSRFIVSGLDSSAKQYSIVSVDPISGTEQLLLTTAYQRGFTPELRPEIEHARWVLLSPVPLGWWLDPAERVDPSVRASVEDTSGRSHLNVLNVETGDQVERAVLGP